MNDIRALMRDVQSVARSLTEDRTHGERAGEPRSLRMPVLLAVCELPGVRQEELAQLLGTDKSTVTRALRELEQGGFIIRESGENDRRCLIARPTDRAYEVLPRMVELRNDWYARATADMAEEERELLCELLARMAANLARPAEQEE